MTITRIRGGQIQDGTLSNNHFAANASIAESKLNIDWTSRYTSALESKKVVDFIQVNNTAVSGGTYDLTPSIPAATAQASSAGTAEGVIIDSPNNKVTLRESVTGNTILSGTNQEVYGRVTFDGTKFVLTFYSMESGTETAFTMPAKNIDFQYAQRFNLSTVNELFAANEKFVEGTADASAYLNIQQLAKDLYGSSWSLDRDGNANLVKGVTAQISDNTTLIGTETSGVTNTSVKAKNIIDEVVSARGLSADLNTRLGGLDTSISNFGLTTAGKGASLVGIQDIGSYFSSSTVEGALQELGSNVSSLVAGTANQEVTNTHTRDAASTNNYFTVTTYANLEDRILSVETVADAKAKVADDNATEISNARKSTGLTGTEVAYGTLDARLEATDTQVKSTNDEVVAARNGQTNLNTRLNGIDTSISNFGLNSAGNGASLVGVQDSNNYFTATNVEGVLSELYQDVTGVKNDLASTTSGKGASLVGIQDSANKFTATTVEGALAEVKGIADSNVSEITTARGSAASLDGRLSTSLKADGSLKDTRIHIHKKVIQSISADTVTYTVADVVSDVATLDVYVNGVLQANGLNFTVQVDNQTIDFGADKLVAGDVLVIKYVTFNA